MDTNFNKLATELDLEELTKQTQREMLPDLITASVIGFSDGDIYVSHLEEYTGRKAELYGQYAYRDGEVVQRMGQAAIANGMKPSEIYNFQGFIADYVNQPGTDYANMAQKSSIRVLPDFLVIDNAIVPTPRPTRMVLELGACLTSRSYARDQIGFAEKGLAPFVYSPLARTHFMNRAIIDSYDTSRYGPGLSSEFIKNGLYIGREDGAAAATEEIIRAQQAGGASIEIADVILSTKSQHTTDEILKPALNRAHRLLREDGMLIVRGLVVPDQNDVGIDAMTEWALDGGFDERNITRIGSKLDIVVSELSHGHTTERDIETVILTKH